MILRHTAFPLQYTDEDENTNIEQVAVARALSSSARATCPSASSTTVAAIWSTPRSLRREEPPDA